MLLLPLLSAIVCGAAATAASAVGDRCSKDLPCEPSSADADADPLFCDFLVGPVAGGYCVACEGRQAASCQGDVTLADEGKRDCVEKCSFRGCAEPCAEGRFCSHYNYREGPCLSCETVVHPEDCASVTFWPDAGVEACEGTCPPRSCGKRRHCLSTNDAKYFCNFAEAEAPDEGPAGTCEPCAGLQSIDECGGRASSDLASKECAEVCEDVILAPCVAGDDCAGDRSFCNRDSSTCQACPTTEFVPDWHVAQCLDADKMGLSNDASKSCADACHTECQDVSLGSVSVEGLVDLGVGENKPIIGTPYASVAGPLVDCQLGRAGECPPDAPQNFVCLISRGALKFSDKVLNCEDSGGIAAVMYDNQEPGTEIVTGTVAGVLVEIPATSISKEDGLKLLNNSLGLTTNVEIKKLRETCERGCSDGIPCPYSLGASYCDYRFETHGLCQQCTDDRDQQRIKCFLSGLSLGGARECADTCESTLAASSCKMCGKAVSGGSLQSAPEGEAKCDFCPDGLKQSHFDRWIPFIGDDVTCFKLNQFFENYAIAENDPNCQMALNFNYICDCEGPGYAGADSQEKRNVLVWLPRISAIVSFLGSSAIIVAVARDKKKRAKIYGQLMVAMSVFDLMGSAAYALTTLPIPKEYHIEGAEGNDATCVAQGFFIQMGTIAAFLNTSLAVYYYCVIQLSWGEFKIKKFRLWLFLCPIAVGLIFAFAGIPFYKMLFLWCNNSASWWPEIPIIIAIIVTTWIMAVICWSCYKTEKASQQYAGASSRDTSMSSAVLRQSLWYLLSFYLTWPPYLALQYLWSAEIHPPYGFVLFACTLVPLQGFWNCAAFFRKKAHFVVRSVTKSMNNITRSVSRPFSAGGFSVGLGRSSKNFGRSSKNFNQDQGEEPVEIGHDESQRESDDPISPPA